MSVIAAVNSIGKYLDRGDKEWRGYQHHSNPATGSLISGRGGIGPAIQGTLIVVGLASLIGAPVGVLAGIYLSEFAGKGIFPSAVRLFNDVLTGLPSIVVGIVGYIVAFSLQ